MSLVVLCAVKPKAVKSKILNILGLTSFVVVNNVALGAFGDIKNIPLHIVFRLVIGQGCARPLAHKRNAVVVVGIYIYVLKTEGVIEAVKILFPFGVGIIYGLIGVSGYVIISSFVLCAVHPVAVTVLIIRNFNGLIAVAVVDDKA